MLGFGAVVVFAISNGNVPKLPFLGEEDVQIEEAARETAPKDAASGDETESAETRPPATKAVAPAVEEPAPKFDLLRVEKDGSVLVAGNAVPNSRISLIGEDGKVIAEDTADDTGAFVVVPDNPLPPGSYALSLRAVDPDGKELVSKATGILNIPEPGNNDTLAMVSEEGEASEVFVKPESAAPAVDEPKPQAETETAPAPETASKSDIDSQTEQESAAEAKDSEVPATDAPQSDVPETAEPETAEPETAETEVASSENAKSETTEAESKAPEEELTKTAKLDDETDKSDEPASRTEPEIAPAPAKAEPDPGESVSSDTAGEAAPSDRVLVEAVEVDGRQIFVAGAVESGKRVRIYLNNQVLGDATGTADDRFLLQRDFVLSNGSHIVRADVVDPLSGKVTGRAEVPLIHEVQVAKVEPSPEPIVQPEPKAEPEPEPKAKPEQNVQDAATSVEEPKAAPEGQPQTDVKTEPDSEAPVVEAKPDEPAAPAVSEPAESEDKVAAVDATPAGEETDQQAAAPEPEAAPEPPAAVASPEAAEPTKTIPVKEPESVEPDEADTAVAKVEETPKSPEPPAVIRTGTSIIIRPGDNLWTISRYTYGRGIHFTTIYNANKDQIRDPDLIYVGQIFKIPDEVERRSEN